MDMLQVRGNQIVDSQSQPVRLRGTCVGGWMNMEHFIDGYPGTEHGLRAAMATVLGEDKARFFFERLLDCFLSEQDIAWMKANGASVVRLPLNYRHFERDDAAFQYVEQGFARLDQAISWCGKHGLYAILDLHAVQGWQNPDWHCDNASGGTLFWRHPHFQERFIALWEELARRCVGNPVIAGYNVMNEPVCGELAGRPFRQYRTDWETLNRIYRQVVRAIRVVDPHHIVFLEGDYYSTRFEGLEPPFAPNLVYSSHNYTAAGLGPGPYPGTIGGQHWDHGRQAQIFQEHEGTRYALTHGVPLWVGEFGSVYNGPAEEQEDRLRALDDQISILDEFGAHWTTWTYKDVGVMGWVQLDPQAEYLELLKPVLDAKRQLAVDMWGGWLPTTPARDTVRSLARVSTEVLGDAELDPGENERLLAQAALERHFGALLQPAYARRFRGMSEAEMDRVLQSFTLQNCRVQQGLADTLKKHLVGPPAPLCTG